MIKNNRPYTDENGYPDERLITDEPEEIQKIVFAWIRANLYYSRSSYNVRTSYGIKHILQQDTTIYLSNNQFKDAMMMLGFHPKNANVLNWQFNIKERSPAFKNVPHGLAFNRDYFLQIVRKYYPNWQ